MTTRPPSATAGGRELARQAGLGVEEHHWAVGFIRALWKKPLGFGALAVILIMGVGALAAPLVAPFGINESGGNFAASPSWTNWFGTDHIGRDVFSRVVYGGRVSMRVGFVAVAMSTIAGGFFGLVAGYFGGWIDHVVSRAIDVVLSIPTILLALTVIASLGASAFNVTLAIAFAITPRTARVARGSALAVKELDYITAARALGATPMRLIMRHILPNAAAPLIVIASIQLGVAIIVEASLSFLGLGVPVNVPTWGNMLSGAGLTYMTRAPWMAIFPGLALTITVLSLNLFGDSLRDILDPKLRGSR